MQEETDEGGWHSIDVITASFRRRWKENKMPWYSLRNLIDYFGRYSNSSKTLSIEINSLAWENRWEKREDDLWPLEHDKYDTFSWLQLRNSMSSYTRRTRSVNPTTSYYLIRLEAITHTSIGISTISRLWLVSRCHKVEKYMNWWSSPIHTLIQGDRSFNLI